MYRRHAHRQCREQAGKQRLVVLVGDHHALGRAGGAPSAADRHHRIGALRYVDVGRRQPIHPAVEIGREAGRGVDAHHPLERARQGGLHRPHLGLQAAMIENEGGVVAGERMCHLRLGIARVEREPDRPRPQDAEHRFERTQVVGGERRYDLTRGDPRGVQPVRDPVRGAPDLAVGPARFQVGEAGAVRRQREAAVEEVDQTHCPVRRHFAWASASEKTFSASEPGLPRRSRPAAQSRRASW